MPWSGAPPTFTTAEFQAASFQSTAGFGGARFQGTAWFEGASFQGWAQFSGASFQDQARFGEASFQDQAGFEETSFKGEAVFRGASFEHATHIGPLLARQLVLDGAAFGARVQLDVTAAALRAGEHSSPPASTCGYAMPTVDLGDANLAAPAILADAPSPSEFPGREGQEQQVTRGWERLPPEPRQQRWRPRLLSIRRADVAGLRLADVDLRACRFAGAHNLDRLRIACQPMGEQPSAARRLLP